MGYVDNMVNELNSDSTLSEYQLAVAAVNEANGWFDSERTPGDEMMLLVSEISEAFEEIRDGRDTDEVYFTVDKNGIDKPEGVPSELADLFIRLMDTCQRFNVNLATEVKRKLAYNATRGHRHGGKVL